MNAGPVSAELRAALEAPEVGASPAPAPQPQPHPPGNSVFWPRWPATPAWPTAKPTAFSHTGCTSRPSARQNAAPGHPYTRVNPRTHPAAHRSPWPRDPGPHRTTAHLDHAHARRCRVALGVHTATANTDARPHGLAPVQLRPDCPGRSPNRLPKAWLTALADSSVQP